MLSPAWLAPVMDSASSEIPRGSVIDTVEREEYQAGRCAFIRLPAILTLRSRFDSPCLTGCSFNEGGSRKYLNALKAAYKKGLLDSQIENTAGSTERAREGYADSRLFCGIIFAVHSL